MIIGIKGVIFSVETGGNFPDFAIFPDVDFGGIALIGFKYITEHIADPAGKNLVGFDLAIFCFPVKQDHFIRIKDFIVFAVKAEVAGDDFAALTFADGVAIFAGLILGNDIEIHIIVDQGFAVKYFPVENFFAGIDGKNTIGTNVVIGGKPVYIAGSSLHGDQPVGFAVPLVNRFAVGSAVGE